MNANTRKCIIVVERDRQCDAVAAALSTMTGATRLALGALPPRRAQRVGLTGIILIEESLYDLKPEGERPRNRRLDELPWWPDRFNRAPKASAAQLIMQLVNAIDGGYVLVDATTENGPAWYALREFMVQENRPQPIFSIHLPSFLTADTLRAALDTPREGRLDPLAVAGKHLEGEISYILRINLSNSVRERLRASGYRVGRSDDLHLGRISSPILGAIAKRDFQYAGTGGTVSWRPIVYTWNANHTEWLRFTLELSEQRSYADMKADLDRLPDEVVISKVSSSDVAVPAPAPFDLPHLVSALTTRDPKRWTPRNVRAALARLFESGAITDPWNAEGAYAYPDTQELAQRLQALARGPGALARVATLALAGFSIRDTAGPQRAIAPTGIVPPQLTDDGLEMLTAIAERWIAQLLDVAVYEDVTISAKARAAHLTYHAKLLVLPGWNVLDGANERPRITEQIQAGIALPIAQREVSSVIIPPPAPYTLGELLAAVEAPKTMLASAEAAAELHDGERLALGRTALEAIATFEDVKLIEHDVSTAWLRLTELGRAVASLLPPAMRFPVPAITYARWARQVAGKPDLTEQFQDYMRNQIRQMVDHIRTGDIPRSYTWKPQRTDRDAQNNGIREPD